MADKHPYTSGAGVLTQVLEHLRRSFPNALTAEVLRKLGFAPKNESYIINIIRFLKLIDDKGARTPAAQKAFTLHDGEAFSKAFSEIVKSAYSDLFALHGDQAWDLNQSKLITFFRQSDQSSELVGKLQAGTFRTLAAYAGHAEAPATSAKKSTTKKVPRPPKLDVRPAPAPVPQPGQAQLRGDGERNLGLTVRIEINLPAAADQETYDRIFKSIRENLLNG